MTTTADSMHIHGSHVNKPHVHRAGECRKNMGFIYNSRLLDLLLTLACIGLAVLGIMMNDNRMVAFAVPAGICLFRQCVPLLTFAYVVSIFMAAAWMASSLEIISQLGIWG